MSTVTPLDRLDTPESRASSGHAGGPGTAKGTLLTRSGGLILTLCVLVVAVLASIAIGSNSLSIGEVWTQLWAPDGSAATAVVRELRVPRTVLGLLVGGALGVAGAQMQSLTRNPLGDPGVLGINAGAGLAVVVAVAVTGSTGIGFYLWFAFAGAAAAAVAVYVLGSAGGLRATPARLALAGVAISAAVSSIIQTVVLSDQEVFNEFRHWAVGSLEGRGWGVTTTVLPFVVLGIAGAAALAPNLNALALGEDAGASLGIAVRRTRALTMLGVAVLCGAATAAAGPIAFVGLGVPYLARAVVGPDERWVVPYSALLGAALLLVADVIGRVLVVPDEIQVGIVTALIGGPVFVAIVRRPRIRPL